jgi:hypothetical protein
LNRESGHQHDFSCLTNLEFDQDTLFHLPALDNYLESMMNRQDNHGSANFRLAFGLVKYPANELQCLSGL